MEDCGLDWARQKSIPYPKKKIKKAWKYGSNGKMLA
jgi:hypothetical protein